MKGKGFAKVLVERLNRLRHDTFIMLPDRPAVIDGQPYWGWLEVKVKDFSIQSVMQNLEHGAMVESAIMDALAKSGQATLGFLKGIETSLWTVSVISFNETDYKKLLAKAYALAKGLKGNFDNIGKSCGDILNDAVTGKLSSGTPAGGAKFSLADLLKDGKLLQHDSGAPDFQAGFEAGIDYYFKHAIAFD